MLNVFDDSNLFFLLLLIFMTISSVSPKKLTIVKIVTLTIGLEKWKICICVFLRARLHAISVRFIVVFMNALNLTSQ